MKVFIDTSIFIRFLTQDLIEKYQECKKFFEMIRDGKIRSYTSNVVFMEIVFVLSRQYKFSKDRVRKVLDEVLKLRNMTLIETTNTPEALSLYDHYNIKYQDCLIITQIPPKTKLITYDSEFRKVRSLDVTTPAGIVKS